MKTTKVKENRIPILEEKFILSNNNFITLCKFKGILPEVTPTSMK
jgi:hypothetical protein